MEFFIARIWKICATIRVIELIFTVEDDRLYTYIYGSLRWWRGWAITRKGWSSTYNVECRSE